jgi:tripartite-type tricarboxylate transporter receptor subunit TctC
MTLIRSALASALLLIASLGAARAAWPDRPITLVVPFAAGAATDIVARVLADSLAERLGASIVVTNRDGASATIGAAAIAQARPDGYTLGYSAIGPITIQPHLMAGLAFKPESFEPVCQTSELPFALAVKPDAPWRTLADLVAAAKAAPGRLRFGVTGTNTIPHLAIIELQLLAGIELSHIPYRGETGIATPLANNEIELAVVTPGFGLRQGMRQLASFTRARVAETPDVPTASEQGFAVVQTVPSGLLAPKGVEPAILERLGRACAEAVTAERFQTSLKNSAQPFAYADAPAFARAIADDFAAKGALIRRAGIKPQ